MEREGEIERGRERKREREKIGNQVFIPVNPGVIGSISEPLHNTSSVGGENLN